MPHRVLVDSFRNGTLLHSSGTVDKLLLLAYIAFVFHLQLDLFCYGFSQHRQDCKQDPRLISAHCRGRSCPYPVFSLSSPVRHPVLCSISYPVPCYKLCQLSYLVIGDSWSA